MTDLVLASIAKYIDSPPCFSDKAYNNARLSLLDSMGCAMLALEEPDCQKILGSLIDDDSPTGKVRVPGTSLKLDQITAAFNIGTLIRWADFNDTWLAAEWGHPSDNLGGLIALFDSQCATTSALETLTVHDLLKAQIKTYEIQGLLAIENSLNQNGIDHVLLVKIATAGVCTGLLGGTIDQIISALSHAFLDGGTLRAYRHGTTTGPRKSWAAGDASSRGLWLAHLAIRSEVGYPTVLTAPQWGFQDVFLKGATLRLPVVLGSYVAENILFKVSFPAEFHGQTAVESALALRPEIIGKIDQIAEILINTQLSAIRIIDKRGPLTSPADRDHCLQYMVAIALLFGELRVEHYRDRISKDPRINQLRQLMTVKEDNRYTEEYNDPNKRAIPNRIQIRFRDGSTTSTIEILYPLGHPRRRTESKPFLREKLAQNIDKRFSAKEAIKILYLWDNPDFTDKLTVAEFIDHFVKK